MNKLKLIKGGILLALAVALLSCAIVGFAYLFGKTDNLAESENSSKVNDISAPTLDISTTSVSSDMQSAWDAVASYGGYIQLTDNWKPGKTLVVSAGAEVDLDLNGYTLSGPGSVDDSIIRIKGGGAQIWLYDSRGGGTITGGSANGGAIFVESGGSLYMDNGTISGNSTGGQDDGAGVYVNGWFEMYGGTIENNEASAWGGGVCVGNGGRFQMYGGTISNNTADEGGGVYVGAGGVFEMFGGQITDNYSDTGYAGGVYLADRSSSMNIQGIVCIDNNRALGVGSSDVQLVSGVSIKVTGSLTGSTVGILLESTTGTFTTGYNSYNSIDAGVIFESNRSGYKVITSSGQATVTSGSLTRDTIRWRYGTSLTSGYKEVYTGFSSGAASVTITYTGQTLQVGAYNSSGTTSFTIDARVYKNASGSDISTSTAIKNVGTYAFISTSQSSTFILRILPANFTADANINYSSSMTYTGSALSALTSVTFNGTALTNNTDYSVHYYNNTNAGTATMTVTGNGNFYGSVTKTFTINPKDISTVTTTLGTTTYTYDGSAKSPSVTVKNGSTTVSSTQYTVTYSNNTNAGTATAVITGKGNYTGSVTKTYTINPVTLTDSMLTLGTTSYTYDGSAKSPTVTVKNGSTTIASSQYTLTYSNNTNAGTAYAIVAGKGNYTGTATKTFTINPQALTSSNSTINLGTSTYTYDGSAKTPAVSSVVFGTKTVPTSNYSIAYSNNINASTTATVTLTFSGNYSGTVNKTFTIDKASLSSATVTYAVSNYTYTGSAISPVPTVKAGTKTLAQDVDFTLTYADNTNAGTGKVTITGTGNYKDTASGTFTIDKRQIFVAGIKVADKAYDGTTDATVDTKSVKLIGVVDADKEKLTLEFKAGTAFDGASVGLHKVEITGVTLKGDVKDNYLLEADEVT
ncbi:MAG: hypothetical protein HDQ88_11625, partial [Clostridia bacterium]|nr:hypothetical protein [Clostridia bacterium]